MSYSTYTLTFMFRIEDEEAATMDELVRKGGGAHVINLTDQRIVTDSRAATDAPHDMLEALSVSKDAIVHSDVTIAPLGEDQ